MEISVVIAIISHLSDAQELVNLMQKLPDEESKIELKKKINERINFAKHILLKYENDLKQTLTKEQLNVLWKEINN